MLQTPQKVPADSATAPRSLLLNAFFPILLIAFLAIPQIATQLLLLRESSQPQLITIANQQATLSQNISKTALEIQVATSDAAREQERQTLSTLIDRWTKAQRGLQYGDSDLGLSTSANNKAVSDLFAGIAPSFDAINAAARCLIVVSDANCTGLRSTHVDSILANENTFLDGMNKIVAHYQSDASARISQAQLISLVIFVVVIITFAFFGALVFRPLAERQAADINELNHSRVALQTAVQDSEARSTELQTVVDVGTQVSTILEVDRLLRDVSDLTKERLRLYHSHIYLLNEAGDTLVLTAGAGAVGRQMVAEKRSIALSNANSIVASAARDRKGIIVNDVRQSPTFLPHPLLPDTASELATPLIARGELIGVIDVQSNMVDFFTPSKFSVVELMAAQIAVAISNARLYETSERVSRRERALGTIDRKIQGAVSVDEILQTTVRELGKALRVPYTAIELQMTPEAKAGAEEAAQ